MVMDTVEGLRFDRPDDNADGAIVQITTFKRACQKPAQARERQVRSKRSGILQIPRCAPNSVISPPAAREHGRRQDERVRRGATPVLSDCIAVRRSGTSYDIGSPTAD